jgi:hypothetical protein
MNAHPSWGIPEAIVNCQNRYGYLTSHLKRDPKHVRIWDFFPRAQTHGKAYLWRKGLPDEELAAEELKHPIPEPHRRESEASSGD